MPVSPRTPRKDQTRNRQRLLEAARAAFTEEGSDLSIETIARRAGVGSTTFYRHFPTKEALVQALLDDLGTRSRHIAEQAADITDHWEAFAHVFIHGCVLDQTDLQLFDTLCQTSARATQQGRDAASILIAPVLERAQRHGLVRPDISADDVAAVMRAADSAPTTTQRRIIQQVLLDGLAIRRENSHNPD